VEIGRLVGDPVQKAAYGRALRQHGRIGRHSRQFSVGKIRMNGAVANRMEGRRFTPAPAAWDRMMPFYAMTKRAAT
jgi:hypothetical protein